MSVVQTSDSQLSLLDFLEVFSKVLHHAKLHTKVKTHLESSQLQIELGLWCREIDVNSPSLAKPKGLETQDSSQIPFGQLQRKEIYIIVYN